MLHVSKIMIQERWSLQYVYITFITFMYYYEVKMCHEN